MGGAAGNGRVMGNGRGAVGVRGSRDGQQGLPMSMNINRVVCTITTVERFPSILTEVASSECFQRWSFTCHG